MIRLSICIPTYNFGRFIGQTLDSILPALTGEVELVILDGGSTDDTSAVVAQKTDGLDQVHYHKQAYRGGIDRDIAKVVSLAQGDYCWLFSADDIMRPGAIKKILVAICSNCDIYLCEQTLCSLNMEPIKAHPIFTGIATPTKFNLGKSEDRKRYFSAARTSEAFFSFLSGPIFRKELWDRAEGIPDSFYLTCWALAGRLLSQMPDGLVVQYLGENLILKRGENDSFMENGVVNRLRISVEGFTHIAETIFGKNSYETRNIRRVIRNERSLFHLLFLRQHVLNSPQKENIQDLQRIVASHYANAGVINAFRYAIFRAMPIQLIRLGELLKNTLLKYRLILPVLFFCELCLWLNSQCRPLL